MQRCAYNDIPEKDDYGQKGGGYQSRHSNQYVMKGKGGPRDAKNMV
jgi:hypothetical protein